ncbi:MAG: formimidoylglutamate deiminase [Woeseiaceae bacterium]|nr:formimidoylglutamate deiminase [Woeseiaceae bacterium]
MTGEAMQAIFAQKALLPGGWADAVRIEIADGRIARVAAGAERLAADEAVDCVIPGLSNSHSHAFQRALAGHAEERSPAGQDNFWSWRERMYELAGLMSAGRLHAIARQAYVEMLSAGYTSVAEFHYLHNDPAGGGEDAMFDALKGAAADSGIRLTYVPVLYERAGFDKAGPEGWQSLFATSADEFLDRYERAAEAAEGRVSVGIGAHSIRAVSDTSLKRIAERPGPIHIHIAEQQREVDQSLAHYEQRPVRWLLENVGVDENWCLVHATHMDVDEIELLAASGAVVSLCPSTEANLGDGLFPLAEYLNAGGRVAIGSDSHITINPFEELRWLEYGQRLASQSRNVATLRDAHAGRELFERAVAGGAQACGHGHAGLAEGGHADLVCLYGDDPMLIGHGDASRLDALVFAGYRLPIERVMVGGAWCVIDGEHVDSDASRHEFAEAVGGIALEWSVDV